MTDWRTQAGRFDAKDFVLFVSPDLMEQEPDSKMRGIVEVLHEIEPGVTRFFPRLQYAGTLRIGPASTLKWPRST
jgi:hypothetical protein